MQNARATGYAIVAARNPSKSFSVYLVKWDGVHDLEYNANNQINPGWHPQAAIKRNYFNQSFDGSDFTYYSSVVVSQAEFDTYKSTGTDWWIVCSTLPSYSNSSLSVSDNGNVGIGTASPNKLLTVNGDSQTNGVSYFSVSSGCAGVGGSGTDLNLYNGIGAETRLTIKTNGNVGIGTTNPNNKLDVNGTIHSKEVKVDMIGWSDFVFKKEYTLPTLEEVENQIKENEHLANIPSEEEVLKNGINLGEMNSKLLQKIEELTLYMIEMKKENERQNKEIKFLKNKK